VSHAGKANQQRFQSTEIVDGGILLVANLRIGSRRVLMDIEKDLIDAFETLLHRDFPNRERIGCPGHDALTKFAARAGDPDVSMLLEHVRQCAPCFSELKKLRGKAL
jgi:hypothetical protein